ncbi:MAG: STAS domain-containing protein [Leptospiraceae bacterium]|nr:STAS domain-containing protein [Leptospiraceae bacterium]MDW8307248.1 STAS domain-containing protein [Leptospiraceae bacterium]
MLSVKYEDGNAIAQIKESRLDIFLSQDLSDQLLFHLEKSKDRLILDTSEVQFIDSAIVGVFIRVHETAKKSQKKLVFINTSSFCQKLFQGSGLKEIFFVES